MISVCKDNLEKSMVKSLNNKGFTLIEVIIVMAVFIVVIMISGDVFRTIVTQSTKLMRSEESNIEGIVGLELFRHDLEQAGFGLPSSFPSVVPIYTEATHNPAMFLNDAPSSVPRALTGINNGASFVDANGTFTSSGGGSTSASYTSLADTDYLAVKATSVGTSNTAQRWTYVNYSGNTYGSKPPKIWASDNLAPGDKVIALKRTFTSTGYNNQLIFDPLQPSIYWTGYSNAGLVPAFSPSSPQEIVYLYGITNTANVGMPFNRTDYFIADPASTTSKPAYCAPHTGVLYKTTVNHANGKLNYIPIMDCVADMQVVLGWDLADSSNTFVADSTQFGDGIIDTWSDVSGYTVASAHITNLEVQAALADASHIRTKLKVVKVFILAQNGKSDPSYISPNSFALFDPLDGGSSVGKNYSLTTDMLNFHWKVYRIVVKPKNLISNQ